MNAPARKIDFSSTAACITAVFLWATAPVFIRYFTTYLDAWTQNLLRYLAASFFWLPFLLFALRKNLFDHSIWSRALLPTAANIIMQTLWAKTMYYIEPAFASLLNQSSLIWIALLSLLLFPQERNLIKSKRFWLGMVLSVIGVTGVLCFKEGFGSFKTTIGIALALGNALGWAVYIISAKIALKNIDSRAGFSVVSIYTVIGLAILALLFGNIRQCLQMSSRPWFLLVISGIFCIAISHALYYAAIKCIGTMIPSIILLSTPFIVLTISHIVFGESLNGPQWFFGLTLLCGSALAVYSQQHLT